MLRVSDDKLTVDFYIDVNSSLEGCLIIGPRLIFILIMLIDYSRVEDKLDDVIDSYTAKFDL